MKLPPGKIPVEILKRVVFKHLGVKRREVISGPAPGLDGALVKVNDKILISSMDPITGAVERIGWLAVNINANDVATFGVQPSLFSSCILLPENVTEDLIETLCEQMDLAAKNLGMAIIGGHTEATVNLDRPIIVGCALGITEPGRYVTSAGSKPGDHIILTKGAGIEGTAIIATERYDVLQESINKSILESAKGFYGRISIVKEAILAFNKGGVNAMHDPTEGGVSGGIHEMADAANLGVRIFEEKIPVAKETSEICGFFKIDPLQLISSGALLISVKPEYSESVINELRSHGIEAEVIGEFLENPWKRIIIHRDKTASDLVRPVYDHLWLALEK